MTVTAIILNYKNYHDACACIISLEKQTLPENCQLQILIIDNNSGDGCTQLLQRDFPTHQYIFNNENFGFAKGVNQGIGLSIKQSDYFLLVNNDAELESKCLNSMLEASDEEALVGPAIFYKNKPNTIWQGGGFFSKLKMNIAVPDKNKHNISHQLQEVDFLSGCILLIPKKIIELVGKFDENFFFYGEDLDFCLRTKRMGLKILYCPQARAWHNIQNIIASRTNTFVLKNLAFSYHLIIKKHYSHLRIYGLILFLCLYSPFRFYQIVRGGNNWYNINAWIKGGLQGWKMKI